jgi:uncharacterized protein
MNSQDLDGTRTQKPRILVTGSARLETLRQGGDSLACRYFLHRLLPYSPAEAKEADAGRWRRQYLDGFVREEILSFENVRELRSMTLLVELLRERVGSPLIVQALSEDLAIAPNTVKRHVEILEALYIAFRVYPHSRNVARSLLKQPKFFFFDSGSVRGDRGAVFENTVAFCLYKRQSFLEDRDGRSRSLRYLRTKEGRGVDFVLVEEEEPERMIEAKHGDRDVAPALRYFHERFSRLLSMQ